MAEKETDGKKNHIHEYHGGKAAARNHGCNGECIHVPTHEVPQPKQPPAACYSGASGTKQDILPNHKGQQLQT
jgi:hypothetical protein